MILIEWITEFNDCMKRGDYEFDRIFRDYDKEKVGGLTFANFIEMNQFVQVSMPKKSLNKVFQIIDRDGSGLVNLEEVRNISNLTMRPDHMDSRILSTDELMETAPEDLRGKNI